MSEWNDFTRYTLYLDGVFDVLWQSIAELLKRNLLQQVKIVNLIYSHWLRIDVLFGSSLCHESLTLTL